MRKPRILPFGRAVFGLCLCVITVLCWGEEEDRSLERLLRNDRTKLNKFLWKEMTTTIKKKEMKIEKPDMRRLLLQIASNPELMLSGLDWVAKTDVMTSETNGIHSVSLKCTNSTYTLQISITKDSDAEAALQGAIETAFIRSMACARGSAWSCEQPEGCIDISGGVSFVASFVPSEGYPDAANYSIGNMEVSMRSMHNVGSQYPASRLIEASKLINLILRDKAEGRPKTAGDEMGLAASTRSTDNTVHIKWSSIGDLKDYWVRMDIDAGSLSIEEGGIVKAESVPDTGATVHLYAISPDGKTWFHKKLKLPASK